MTILSTTDENFSSDVLKNPKPVLVDFWAEWCGPCRALLPTLEELAEEMSEQIDVIKVNIDQNPESPVKYGVRSIPSLMVFKNGDCLETKVGVLSKEDLRQWIERVI